MEGLGINWKILIGQSVNFIILLLILKKFVYKPFLGLLEKRRAGIEDGIKKTQEAEKSLQNIRGMSDRIKENSEKEAQEFLKKAELRAQNRAKEISDLAEKERQKMLEAARIAVEKEVAEERKTRDKEAMEKTIILAEKFLKEKFTEEKDKKLIEELSADL
jgi:F-type H+-transporting ATPase subunit b